MLPSLAVLALTSLLVVSASALPIPKLAGSLEGGLRPDGRIFSSCEGGRSMAKAVVKAAAAVEADCSGLDRSNKAQRSSHAM